MRERRMLYTKSQILYLLAARECKEPLPTKNGHRIFICHPRNGEPYQVDLEIVERTDLKSDYGERLWGLTQSSREGRLFDQTVQEAHVIEYRADFMEKYRQANLQRHEALASQYDH